MIYALTDNEYSYTIELIRAGQWRLCIFDDEELLSYDTKVIGIAQAVNYVQNFMIGHNIALEFG